MSLSIPRSPRPAIIYPDSDGQPIAENTLQFEWIVTIKGGLDTLFDDDPNVFVAGDLLWYPVKGDPKINVAPDALVAFGRPKGYRGSYMQWEEQNIPPQVVFEVLSPGNRPNEMIRKHQFYERYGVEEYYLYNPDTVELTGWIRRGVTLVEIVPINGHTSPRLDIRFELSEQTLSIIGPDGRRFQTFGELARQRNGLEAERKQLVRERDQMASARDEMASARDELARRNNELDRQMDEDRRKAERLAAQLRSLGVEPDA